MKLLNVATCILNQWAMIYYCNMNNIKESISRAKEASAVIRRGPELEITGYGCEDHFLELDTVTHAWECLQELFLGDWTDGILCCFGMPVIKGSENFSCQLGSKKSILRTYCSQSKYLSLYRRQLCLSAMVIVSFWTRATHTCGEVYMYSNQQGCDGGRLYYDGRSCIFVNGNMVAQGSQFSMKDVELAVAQIDMDAVTSRRGSICSFQEQASCKQRVSSVVVPYKLCQSFNLQMSLSSPLKIQYQSPEEEIDFGPGCWLWDYLRRSGASGFLLPLSEIVNGDEQDKADAIRIGHYTDGQFPTDSKEFVKRVFYTVFMGSENSSDATKTR